MPDAALIIPRRLAIEILHQAQIAQPQSMRGIVSERHGAPDSVILADDPRAANAPVWARLWSVPQAAAVPRAEELTAGELSLVVSLNTKGVLEMRAWRLVDGQTQEQILKIHE